MVSPIRARSSVSRSIAPVDFFRGSGSGDPKPLAASSDDETMKVIVLRHLILF